MLTPQKIEQCFPDGKKLMSTSFFQVSNCSIYFGVDTYIYNYIYIYIYIHICTNKCAHVWKEVKMYTGGLIDL